MNMTSRNHHHREIKQMSDLSRIERLVMEHVERYRLTTRCGWRGAQELAGIDQNRIARAVRRLTTKKLLRRGILYGSIHYFELAPAGAELLGLSPRRSTPLSEPARYRAFAQLLFGATGGKRRQLLNSAELETLARDAVSGTKLSVTGLPWGIFRDTGDVTQLSVLLVDRSTKMKVRHLGHHLRRSIITLSRHPFIGRKIETDTFTFAVITPSVRRGVRISQRIARYEEVEHVNVSLMVAAGLLPLWRVPQKAKEVR